MADSESSLLIVGETCDFSRRYAAELIVAELMLVLDLMIAYLSSEPYILLHSIPCAVAKMWLTLWALSNIKLKPYTLMLCKLCACYLGSPLSSAATCNWN